MTKLLIGMTLCLTAGILPALGGQRIYQVSEFGAVGDGATDDRAAIQPELVGCVHSSAHDHAVGKAKGYQRGQGARLSPLTQPVCRKAQPGASLPNSPALHACSERRPENRWPSS